jgi:hypothetical protein
MAILEGEKEEAAPAIPPAAVAGEGVIDVACRDCDKKELRPEVEEDDNGDAPPSEDAMDEADPMLPTTGVCEKSCSEPHTHRKQHTHKHTQLL